MTEKMVDE
ncbi:Protein of unknown function [Lactobacillus delbrueckii subsp. lactis]|nr:Protein of unknown function [Lactobacillus delbrueckii subsp. bulgaricus]CDR78297.1 Putative uncharacterized protein [Lactobacillus delbrueckii subsp. lactis]CDR81758.1 Protein of unknown function [Lactobacillus delbrueckii subsp. lactis]CDR83691.1 Protein of unknown function [Lactobacillus delbrueckii subsp. lactis]CDR85797.1 Protein of unknown function [Lactobacillus delbrueckii subsp. lactis]